MTTVTKLTSRPTNGPHRITQTLYVQPHKAAYIRLQRSPGIYRPAKRSREQKYLD
jgi:hypothetical protein